MVRFLGPLSLTVLVLLFVCLTPGCYSALMTFNSHYIALNYDAMNTLEGSPYVPAKNQTIQLNLDLSMTEATFEFYFFWLDYSSGPFQPVFFAGDAQTYMLVTPRINAAGVTVNPGIRFVAGGTTQDITLNGFASNQWVHLVVALRPSSAGKSYAFAESWNDLSQNLDWLEGTVSNFDALVTPNDLPAGSSHVGDVPDRQGTPITAPYTGKIDEYRIWNKFLDVATTRGMRDQSLAGTEANLFAYFRFDEDSGLAVVDDSPSQFTGTLAGTDANLINRMKMSDPASGSFASPPTRFAPFVTAIRETTIDTPATLPFTATNDPGTLDIYIDAPPPYGEFCVLDGCTGTSSSPVSTNSFSGEFDVTYTPGRGSCGHDTSSSFYVTSSSGMSNSAYFVVRVPALATQLTDTATQRVDTRGGSVTFSAINLGLDGALAGNEPIVFHMQNGDNITCTNGQANNGEVSCDVPAGFGIGDVEATLCNNVLNLAEGFAYNVPTIANITVTNATIVYITGDFFGPSRTTFDSIYETVVLVRGNTRTPCNISSVEDHTALTCEVATPLTTATYTVEVSFGGQTGSASLDFDLCNPACEHGGKCVGLNTCDCDGTGYEGDMCQTELKCSPVCANGGICERQQDDSLACNCPAAFTGPSCSDPVDGTSEEEPESSSSLLSYSASLVTLLMMMFFF